MRSRIVWLVVLASLVCSLVPCLLWTAAAQHALRAHFDEAGPVALGWGAERTRDRLAAARAEIEQIGLAYGSGGRIEEMALREALGASEFFSALLVLDREGNLKSLAGSGPALESLLVMFDARSALETELVAAMQGAQLRKQLGSVEAAAIQVFDALDQPPLPIAGMPLRNAGGHRVGALQGLVKRDEIASALPRDLLGIPTHVFLIDAGGQVVASNGLGTEVETASAGADGGLLKGLLALVTQGWSLRYQAPLDALDWRLVAEAPMLEAFRPLVLVLALTLVIPPALALCFGLIALWRSTRLARPLWRLYTGLRQAARDEDLDELDVGRAGGEVGSLLEAFNATIRRLQNDRAQAARNNKALREQNQAFQAQHKSLAKLTVTDPLTQLANRRFFENQLNMEIKRLARHGQGLSMLMIDVDDFKKLNDTLGHAAGDEFLKQIARILQETVRATDLVARYGGEEFVVVATNTDVEGATIMGEKVRTAVAEASFIVDSSMRPQRASISVGVAEFRGSQTDLFNSADAALYEAKSAGKNCVVSASAEGKGKPV